MYILDHQHMENLFILVRFQIAPNKRKLYLINSEYYMVEVQNYICSNAHVHLGTKSYILRHKIGHYMCFLFVLPLSFEGSAVCHLYLLFSDFLFDTAMIWSRLIFSLRFEMVSWLFQGKNEHMIEYIKKLKSCVKWFMELEDGYLTELENIRSLYESEKKRHAELGNQRLSI